MLENRKKQSLHSIFLLLLTADGEPYHAQRNLDK